jgi:Domain of unknown function (DUF4261)
MDARTPNFAFVLLSRPELPDAEAVVRSFASLSDRTLRSSEADDAHAEVLKFEIDDDSDALVMLLPIPVPNGEADEAARFSLSAFGTGWTLPPHAAHLVVTLQSETPQLESMLTLTSLLAAVAEASSAVGIYWGNAGATHDPEFFINVARDDDDDAKLMLWTGVSFAKEPDGRLSLLSLGMKQFGLPDMWLVAPQESDPLPWLLDMLNYVVSRGEPLPDGDTVGRTASEKLPVRYVPSPIDDETKVCKIEQPLPSKSKFFRNFFRRQTS